MSPRRRFIHGLTGAGASGGVGKISAEDPIDAPRLLSGSAARKNDGVSLASQAASPIVQL